MSGPWLARGIAVLAACTSAACVAISYEPRITLGVSPETIPLRIEVRELRDASPPEDKERRFGGAAATAPDSLSGKLETALTDALIVSFRNDAVFSETRRRPERPDLVMTGSIRRLYGRAYLHPVGYAAMLPLFVPVLLGVPVYATEAQVDLEISFERVNGERVAVYSASSDYGQWFSLYRSPFLSVGSRLNQLLASVVADMRQQILADRARLLEAALRPPASLGPSEEPDLGGQSGAVVP